MRKQNSEFKTAFISEADNDLKNTDYFGFVELDNYACYVVADGIDDQLDAMSAKLAVSAVVSAFSESPSMSKKRVKTCLKAANKALLEAKSKMHLKASVVVVLTDYVKLRYGQAGNIRLRLYRNGFLKYQTADQSLTMDMVKEEKVEQDKVAVHEERNNLYTYLGQEGAFYPYISKKIKLTNADAIALYTRGIWEHVDEGEIKDVFADATDDPQKTVEDVEDLLLSRQPKDLQKYTLAVVFVNKIYTDPNKKRNIKRIIMTAIPILILLVTFSIMFYMRYRKKMEKIESMNLNYTDTIEYIQVNNYTRAQEKCKNAQKLAEELKDKKMQTELGNYLKLIETVIEGDDKLSGGKYSDAQRAYQEAANRSRYVDLIGMDYIEEKLQLTANYMSVYDLISLGDTLAYNLQYDKAEEKYLEAKALAGKIYFDSGRTAAMDALEQLYSDQKEEKEASAQAVQDEVAQQETGANQVAKGDEAFAQGDYDSAKVYYTTALQKYEELGDEIQKAAVKQKMESTDKKIEQKEKMLKEAQGYLEEAQNSIDQEDLTAAKKYYLLAKDVYASMKEQDKIDEITRKMELLEIKAEEKESREQESMEQESRERESIEEASRQAEEERLRQQESSSAQETSESTELVSEELESERSEEEQPEEMSV